MRTYFAIALVLALLTVSAGVAAPAADAQGLRTPATLRAPVFGDGNVYGGAVRSTVAARTARYASVEVVVAVYARRSATARLYASACTERLYVPCQGLQRQRLVRLRPGRTAVRWRLRVKTRRPLNTVSVTLMGGIAPLASNVHIVRG